MSKSGGNAVSPIDMSKQFGADILRLWVVSSDFSDDIRFGTNIIEGLTDVYRRIRNTFSYLLGNLNGFDVKADGVSYQDMSEFDQWVLHRLTEVDQVVRQSIKDFDFLTMINTLHHFCNRDLSAFYFDVNKDNLYCNGKDDVKRRATLTVLDHVFQHLVHWLAPILSFTCEEAYLHYHGRDLTDREISVHLNTMPEVRAEWKNDKLSSRFERIWDVRRVVNGALERKREEKIIGKSLEAEVTIFVTDDATLDVLKNVHFADIAIVSGVEIACVNQITEGYQLDDVAGVAVRVTKSEQPKCARCWKQLPDVGTHTDHPEVCGRCAAVIAI